MYRTINLAMLAKLSVLVSATAYSQADDVPDGFGVSLLQQSLEFQKVGALEVAAKHIDNAPSSGFKIMQHVTKVAENHTVSAPPFGFKMMQVATNQSKHDYSTGLKMNQDYSLGMVLHSELPLNLAGCWPMHRHQLCCQDVPLSFDAAMATSVCVIISITSAVWGLAKFIRSTERGSQNVASHHNDVPRLHCIDGVLAIWSLWIIIGYASGGSCPDWMTWVFIKSGEAGTRGAMQCVYIVSGFMLVHRYGATNMSLHWQSGLVITLRRWSCILPSYFANVLLEMWFAMNGSYSKYTVAHVAWPISAAAMHGFWPVSICGSSSGMSVLAWQVHWCNFPVTALVIFYACFPIFYNHMPQRCCTIMMAMVGLAVLKTIGNMMLLSLFPDSGLFLYIFPLVHIPEFLVGMLSAQLLAHLPDSVTSWHHWSWAFDFSVLSVFYLIFVSAIGGAHDKNGGDYGLSLPVGLICCMASCAERNESKEDSHTPFYSRLFTSGLLWRALSCNQLTVMAQFSHAAYMLQFVAGQIVDLIPMISACPRYVSRPTVAYALAILVHFFVEMPLRRGFERQVQK